MKSSRKNGTMAKSGSTDEALNDGVACRVADCESFVRMPQRALVSYLFMRHGRGWLIAMMCLISAMAAAAFFLSDFRWLIAALMVLFIVAPACLAFLYINYALHPLVAFNVLPHRIMADAREGEIWVDVFAPVSAPDSVDSEDSSDCPESGARGEGDRCQEYVVAVREKFKCEGFGAYRSAPGGFTLEVSNGKGRGILWIPQSGKVDYEALEIVIKMGARK